MTQKKYPYYKNCTLFDNKLNKRSRNTGRTKLRYVHSAILLKRKHNVTVFCFNTAF